jgi:hypothetical protein
MDLIGNDVIRQLQGNSGGFGLTPTATLARHVDLPSFHHKFTLPSSNHNVVPWFREADFCHLGISETSSAPIKHLLAVTILKNGMIKAKWKLDCQLHRSLPPRTLIFMPTVSLRVETTPG